MAQTLLLDYGDQPVTSLWNGRNQTTLVSTDGDLIRTTEGESPTTRGIATAGAIGLDAAPTYRTPANSGVSGKSAAQFSPGGSSHGALVTLGGAGVGPTGFGILDDIIANNAFTIMLVFQAEADSVSGDPDSTNSGARFIEDDGLNVSLRYFTNAGVQQMYGVNADGSGDKLGPVNFTRDIPQLVTYRHDSGNIYLSINGGTELSVASGNTTSLTANVWFGTSIIYGGFSTAKWYEMRVWDTGDADGNLATQQTDLITKWGIAVGEPLEFGPFKARIGTQY